MRVLVISDVHANLIALDEVLNSTASVEWLGQTGFDAIWSVAGGHRWLWPVAQ